MINSWRCVAYYVFSMQYEIIKSDYLCHITSISNLDEADIRYLKLGPEGVIERLMNRREHFLAVKICEYLEIPADRVYTNWACLKVSLIRSS